MAIVVPAATRTAMVSANIRYVAKFHFIALPSSGSAMLRAEIPHACELLHTAFLNRHHSRVQQAGPVNWRH